MICEKFAKLKTCESGLRILNYGEEAAVRDKIRVIAMTNHFNIIIIFLANFFLFLFMETP